MQIVTKMKLAAASYTYTYTIFITIRPQLFELLCQQTGRQRETK